MGHLRLKGVPKSQPWVAVVFEIQQGRGDQQSAARVAAATAHATELQLQQLKGDPSVTHCFWLLARLAEASRRSSFAEELKALGLSAEHKSALSFMAEVASSVRESIGRNTGSGAFADLASLALRKTLSEAIGHQGPGLFGSSLDDVQHALRAVSTQNAFANLSQRFFGDFLGRTLTFFVDRAVPSALLSSSTLHSVNDTRAILDSVDLHARQSALILHDFAGEWYSKHDWKSGGRITHAEAEGFVAYGLEKLRAELRREIRR